MLRVTVSRCKQKANCAKDTCIVLKYEGNCGLEGNSNNGFHPKQREFFYWYELKSLCNVC